ncbi:uncharacterized protein LOC132179598 [Corylus avellana]|uniref:uncharacterized protein LOC132179598 n=1 Tax=Corylus avellana TaxID=13451 RepID=UPI00286C6D50|nr:uncharacterized protein LOC132179598 [Corylus avellana]
MASNPSLLPEIGPDGLPREAHVIAYTEKIIAEEQLQLKKCRKSHPLLPHTISAKPDVASAAWSHTFKPHGRKKNPSRRYFSCPKYGTGEPHCRFFEWFDDPVCEGYCDLIPALTAQNELLCHEIRNKDATIRRLQFSVIALNALLLGIMLAPTILPGGSAGGSCKRMLPF